MFTVYSTGSATVPGTVISPLFSQPSFFVKKAKRQFKLQIVPWCQTKHRGRRSAGTNFSRVLSVRGCCAYAYCPRPGGLACWPGGFSSRI